MTRPIPTGARIRERRLALGRRQMAVAAAAGISPSYLNLIEHGRRAIGGALLGRLADALGVDRATLSKDGDAALVGALATLGAARLGRAPTAQAAELARRHPDWAGLLVALAEEAATADERVARAADRIAHDPALAAALHDAISAAATLRSTASILAATPEIDPNWRERFHANLDDEGRRLADGMDRLAALLSPAPDPEPGPGDDDGGDPAVEAISPRDLDAARGPDDLLEATNGDLAVALRAMAARDPDRALAVCDASGGFLRRRPVPGFAIPAREPGCALWPLYAAFARPGQPLAARIETPDGARWLAQAIAAPVAPAGFDAPPVLRATMLVTRADGPDPAVPVGATCRLCPRRGCVARRVPSILPVP